MSARRQFKRVWLALLVTTGFSMGHLAGAAQKDGQILRAKSIIAKGYELRGFDGQKRASFSQSPDGGGRLSFFDHKGVSRLEIGIDSHGAARLVLYDENHVSRAAVRVYENGTPVISLSDKTGEQTVGMSARTDGGSSLEVGKLRQGSISVGVANDGKPHITIWDPSAKPRIEMAVSDDGPNVSVHDESGRIRAFWGATNDGSPAFRLYDRASRPRLIISMDKDGKASIRFLDANRLAIREVRADLD
jgi:hypothetical protein